MVLLCIVCKEVANASSLHPVSQLFLLNAQLLQYFFVLNTSCSSHQVQLAILHSLHTEILRLHLT